MARRGKKTTFKHDLTELYGGTSVLVKDDYPSNSKISVEELLRKMRTTIKPDEDQRSDQAWVNCEDKALRTNFIFSIFKNQHDQNTLQFLDLKKCKENIRSYNTQPGEVEYLDAKMKSLFDEDGTPAKNFDARFHSETPAFDETGNPTLAEFEEYDGGNRTGAAVASFVRGEWAIEKDCPELLVRYNLNQDAKHPENDEITSFKLTLKKEQKFNQLPLKAQEVMRKYRYFSIREVEATDSQSVSQEVYFANDGLPFELPEKLNILKSKFGGYVRSVGYKLDKFIGNKSSARTNFFTTMVNDNTRLQFLYEIAVQWVFVKGFLDGIKEGTLVAWLRERYKDFRNGVVWVETSKDRPSLNKIRDGNVIQQYIDPIDGFKEKDPYTERAGETAKLQSGEEKGSADGSIAASLIKANVFPGNVMNLGKDSNADSSMWYSQLPRYNTAFFMDETFLHLGIRFIKVLTGLPIKIEVLDWPRLHEDWMKNVQYFYRCSPIGSKKSISKARNQKTGKLDDKKYVHLTSGHGSFDLRFVINGMDYVINNLERLDKEKIWKVDCRGTLPGSITDIILEAQEGRDAIDPTIVLTKGDIYYHHVVPINSKEVLNNIELAYTPFNIIAVCGKTHDSIHGYGDKSIDRATVIEALEKNKEQMQTSLPDKLKKAMSDVERKIGEA